MRVPALLLSLALAGTALAFVEETPADPPADQVAEICGETVPDVGEGEQLVAKALYFHGEHPVGNPAQAAAFPTLSYAPEKVMDDAAPTGEDHKYDAITAGSNPNFAGNPASAYWVARLMDLPEIACARVLFFGEIAGDVDARLFIDKSAAAVEPDALAPAVPWNEGATFTGWEADFGVIDHPQAYQVVVQISHNSQTDPTDSGVVAYDSAAVPSRLEYVTVVPAPTVVEASPTE